MRATLLESTIYSLVFTALGGQYLKKIALQKAEQGITIETNRAYYFDPEASSSVVVGRVVSANFSTSGTARSLPVDLWNHPRVPLLDSLEKAGPSYAGASESPWVSVETTSNLTYAPCTGVNTQDLRLGCTSRFSLPFAYLCVDCDLYSQQERACAMAFMKTQSDVWPILENNNHTDGQDQFDLSTGIYRRAVYFFCSFFLRNISTHTKPAVNINNRSVQLVYGTVDWNWNVSFVTHLRRSGSWPLSDGAYFTGQPYDVVRHNSIALRELLSYSPTVRTMPEVGQAGLIDDYIYGNPPYSDIAAFGNSAEHLLASVTLDWSSLSSWSLQWSLLGTPIKDDEPTVLFNQSMNPTLAEMSYEVPIYKMNIHGYYLPSSH
ncbi:hypothetical protein K469DRAFT_696073 [Zopfia rhizophila CBS 207.26]|uniref:Uncharacterized protein n=1 Tax=Zopfia rhizophila CBS 207.26 TaxID=1314779 RepID=A0A6A6EMP1_9PEZI|nr:hypothetical protein K469DRAFT_696073 [Zopfia rhizophila CBS 207.26]